MIIVVVLRVQTIVYVMAPLPEAVIHFCQTFHVSMFVGLLALNLLIMSDWLLYIPLFLALYVVLRRTDRRYMAIALQTALVASLVHFASNTAFHMIALNGQYMAATTDMERAMTLAAGTQMMTIDHNATSYISHILTAFSGLIISVVMLRSYLFGDAVAYIGIVANLLAFGLFVPGVGVWISLMASVGLGIWYLLIGWQLLWLASNPYIHYAPQRYRLCRVYE